MVVYRKKPYAKRPIRRRRKMVVSKPIKKYIQRALTRKQDFKHVTAVATEGSYSTVTGQYNVLNMYQIAQGTSATTRTGNVIDIKGISIRGNMCSNSTTTAKTIYVRLALVETGQSEIYTANTTEIFCDTAAAGAWDNLATSQMPVIYTPLNRKAFRIHWEKVYKLNAQSTDGSWASLVKKWIPLKGKIQYDSNSTGASNQSRNFALIMLLAEAGNDVGVGETVEFSYNVRQFFTDS